jgi:hypothetical protein
MTENSSSSFWNTLLKKFYALPEHPPLEAEHSLVYTFDSSLKYFPLQDETTIPLHTQAIFFTIYIIIWSIIISQGCKDGCTMPYLVGFLVGLLLIVFESYFYSMITNVQLLQTQNKTIQPYVSNLPQVDSIKTGVPIENINKHVYFNTSGGHGDYKILFDNNYLPRSDTQGYILPAKTFLEKSLSGDIQSMNFKEYLQGKEYKNHINKNDVSKYNPGTQSDVDLYSSRITKLSTSAYYITMIIVTWAMYVTNSMWGSTRQLYWNLLTILLAVISGAIILTGQNIVSYNYNIYLKKRLLIMAISLGVTSILII